MSGQSFKFVKGILAHAQISRLECWNWDGGHSDGVKHRKHNHQHQRGQFSWFQLAWFRAEGLESHVQTHGTMCLNHGKSSILLGNVCIQEFKAPWSGRKHKTWIVVWQGARHCDAPFRQKVGREGSLARAMNCVKTPKGAGTSHAIWAIRMGWVGLIEYACLSCLHAVAILDRAGSWHMCTDPERPTETCSFSRPPTTRVWLFRSYVFVQRRWAYHVISIIMFIIICIIIISVINIIMIIISSSSTSSSGSSSSSSSAPASPLSGPP